MRSNKDRWLVVALLLSLAGMDLTLRFIAPYLSDNLRHIASLPALAQDAGNRNDLVFLGNSLTNNGVDAELIDAALPDRGVTKLVPDGSSFWEWYCTLKHQVLEVETNPKLLAIGFAWQQLSDQSRQDPTRLGAFFCTLGDIPTLSRYGMDSIGTISEFITAKLLHTFALRNTLRNRLLDLLVPDYREFTQEANLLARDMAANNGTGVNPTSTHSYEEFTALVTALEGRGTRIVVVAMPVRDRYELDAPLLSMLKQTGISLLDYRALPGIDDNSYLDSMHLNTQGSRVLTHRLIQDILPLLARTGI